MGCDAARLGLLLALVGGTSGLAIPWPDGAEDAGRAEHARGGRARGAINVLLTGPRRSGKSSLLQGLLEVRKLACTL